MTRMKQQPKWPKGKAPHRIEFSNSRAFMDGEGNWFNAPPGVTFAHCLDGVWYWGKQVKSESH